jgi:type II secretory pathway pseudopilin PulG
MFDSIGSKLKTIAKVVCVFIIIASLAGGIVTAISVGKAAAIACDAERYVYRGEKDDTAGFFAGAGAFLAITVSGFIMGIAASSALYGIGESVENSEAAKKAAEQNRAMLRKLTGAPAADGKNPSAAKSAAKPVFKPDAAPDAKEDAPAPIDDTKMRCPKCGAVQPKGRSVCWDCGIRFTAEDAPAAPAKTDAWFCVSCGKKNEASAKFCMRCGTPKV